MFLNFHPCAVRTVAKTVLSFQKNHKRANELVAQSVHFEIFGDLSHIRNHKLSLIVNGNTYQIHASLFFTHFN